jgi:prepilin-type N-terminal cleavage/methylation domain-containing protein
MHTHAEFCRRGFSLLELLLVLMLLAVAIVPMLNAFRPALMSQSTEQAWLVFHNRARGTLSRVMSLPFSTLYAARSNQVNLVTLFGGAGEAAKESFVFSGTNWQPRVAIIDASGGTGGLLQVSVSLQDVTLKALTSEY